MLYVVIIWTLVAIILHFSDVGKFKDWPVISWPWKWSCLCVLEWFLIFLAAMIAFSFGMTVLAINGFSDLASGNM